MTQDPHQKQQHDHEQQKKQPSPSQPFQLLSDEGDDGEQIIIPVDDDNISTISISSSSFSPIYASINTNQNQENATMTMKRQQKEEEKKKDRRNRVIYPSDCQSKSTHATYQWQRSATRTALPKALTLYPNRRYEVKSSNCSPVHTIDLLYRLNRLKVKI
jgi:hypothetical protein